MILGVHATTSNEHDGKELVSLLDKIAKSQRKQVTADKDHSIDVLEAIAHNLKRSPELLCKLVKN